MRKRVVDREQEREGEVKTDREGDVREKNKRETTKMSDILEIYIRYFDPSEDK